MDLVDRSGVVAYGSTMDWEPWPVALLAGEEQATISGLRALPQWHRV
jgi:hypothetical protein